MHLLVWRLSAAHGQWKRGNAGGWNRTGWTLDVSVQSNQAECVVNEAMGGVEVWERWGMCVCSTWFGGGWSGRSPRSGRRGPPDGVGS